MFPLSLDERRESGFKATNSLKTLDDIQVYKFSTSICRKGHVTQD